jgi:hypothetical protein
MKIGNVDINLPTNIWMTTITWIFWSVLIIGALVIIGWFGLSWYRKKKVYIHPVTLIQIRADGTQKERTDLLGGRFVNKSGVNDFKIKVPKQWKAKELGYMPDFSMADANDRLIFITTGDNSLWQQCKKRLILTDKIIADLGYGKKVYEYDLLVKPVPTDIKTVTINNLRSWKEVLDKSKLTAFTIAIAAFLIMVVAHLISLYIQTKIRCPTPAP